MRFSSVIASPPALRMIAATVSPAGLMSSSSTSVKVMAPELSSTGALLIEVTYKLAVSEAVLNAVASPLSETSTPVWPLVPLA